MLWCPGGVGWWGWQLLCVGEQSTLGQPEHRCRCASPVPVGVRSVPLPHAGLVPAPLAMIVSLFLAPRPGRCAALGCAGREGVGSLGRDFDVNIC